MVRAPASRALGLEFYPGLCSYSVFVTVCNASLLQVRPMVTSRLALTCCKLVSHLHTCHDKFAESLQICCKLKLLSRIVLCYRFAGHNGAEWIEQRRFAMKTLKDIGIGRIAWESSVESEVEDFVQLLEQQGGKPYDVHDPLSTSVSNNITSIILGKPLLRGDPRRAIVDGGIEGAIMSFSSSSLASLFPFLMQFLAKLGLSSHADTFKKVSDFHNFIKSEMERRKKIPSDEWNEEIFIDGYLKEIEKIKGKGMKAWFNENNLMGSSQALLIGGSDTSRTFLSWIFLAMAAYPEVQKNVQKEIDAILGKDGKLPWSERAKLPYTYATILETNRWRSITPLGVLHCASEDTKIGQYDIPKGSSVLPNIYSLHNDPKYWKDPDSFRPERFLDKNGCLIPTRLDSYAPFSLEQNAVSYPLRYARSQIAILVCSRLALQICKLSANLSRQVRKYETSLQQFNASLEVTIGRTCSKLALQTIAKTEYEHNPG
ncbi:Vitamin D 25-hydroxylase [Araneus ventricosus]|uniref:Vitamin D 25-hydroxylase n=1 Tax=Araneus ventricosus TaxID=182803 RepID=A0A4Y2H1J7_ARAVE|nr:Vitamin D 25-hydroxylase [Araneus ventricosus]